MCAVPLEWHSPEVPVLYYKVEKNVNYGLWKFKLFSNDSKELRKRYVCNKCSSGGMAFNTILTYVRCGISPRTGRNVIMFIFKFLFCLLYKQLVCYDIVRYLNKMYVNCSHNFE